MPSVLLFGIIALGGLLLLGSRGREVWPSDEKETQEGNERKLRRG